MSDLSKFTDSELRAELKRRSDERTAIAKAGIDRRYPCPICGAGVAEWSTEMIQEHRQAPRDNDGIPMLYMPYETGEVFAREFEYRITCENGHVTRSTGFREVDPPQRTHY